MQVAICTTNSQDPFWNSSLPFHAEGSPDDAVVQRRESWNGPPINVTKQIRIPRIGIHVGTQDVAVISLNIRLRIDVTLQYLITSDAAIATTATLAAVRSAQATGPGPSVCLTTNKGGSGAADACIVSRCISIKYNRGAGRVADGVFRSAGVVFLRRDQLPWEFPTCHAVSTGNAARRSADGTGAISIEAIETDGTAAAAVPDRRLPFGIFGIMSPAAKEPPQITSFAFEFVEVTVAVREWIGANYRAAPGLTAMSADGPSNGLPTNGAPPVPPTSVCVECSHHSAP